MRLIFLLLLLVGPISSAEENFDLGVKLNLTPSCQLRHSGRGYYLNLCPTGMVMVGATPIGGNPGSIQVLCASLEVTCTN